MKQESKVRIAVLVIGIILIGAAVYLYYQQGTDEKKENQSVPNVTTEEDEAAEVQETATDELVNSTKDTSDTDKESKEAATTAEKKQNKKLPDMTEEKAWDEGYVKVVGNWYFATLWEV